MNEELESVSGGVSLIRAIAQAMVILAVSVGLAQWFLFPLIQDKPLRSLQAWEVEYLTSGTIDLLADELSREPALARKAALQRTSTDFGFEVRLLPIEDVKLDPQALERLRRHEVVGDASNYSAYRQVDDVHILIFERIKVPAQHLINEAKRRHMGTLAVLKQVLKDLSGNERERRLAEIADQFGYPVALVTLSEIELPSPELTELKAGRIVTIQTSDSISADYPAEMVYQRLGDKFLVLGPFSPPTLRHFYPLVFGYYVILGLVVLLPLVLWLIPTWRSMNQLSSATNAFGRGEFERRAKRIRGSNSNYLIDIFNQMAEKIQSLVESKKSLINAVSHELRTPLSRIEFNIELARQSTDIAERNVQLDRIEKSVDELKTMVTELLEYARFDREKPNFSMESVDIGEWLSSEIANWRQDAQELVFTVSTPAVPVRVSIERYYMSRAIGNLVRNAIRFAKYEIKVAVRINDEYMEISVSDDGPGVDFHERTNIFQPFVRLDHSRNRDSGGSGLGLAIVKQIASWHSGSVWADESEVGGAQFIFSWPIVKET